VASHQDGYRQWHNLLLLISIINGGITTRSERIMKSFLFATVYISDLNSEYSISIYKKWLAYYKNKKSLLGVDHIILIDDGSSMDDLLKISNDLHILEADKDLPVCLPDGIVVFHFKENLGRSENNVFPGWMRSFFFASKIAKQYSFDKIIQCESDAYLIRNRIFRYVKNVETGWVAFWCPWHSIPESAIQVICKNQFDLLETYFDLGEGFWRQEKEPIGPAEKILPFSYVNKRFIGDRFGEYRDNYPGNADYICQSTLNTKIRESNIIKVVYGYFINCPMVFATMHWRLNLLYKSFYEKG
jgi:hypothetical protein